MERDPKSLEAFFTKQYVGKYFFASFQYAPDRWNNTLECCV
jgi:hypothetical protein